MTTKRTRGRPTTPPPDGVRQVVIGNNGITVEDADGKCFVRWRDLKFLRTKRVAIDTYRAMSFKEVAWEHNKRGTVVKTVLHKAIRAVSEERTS